jgi:hypothetical protein
MRKFSLTGLAEWFFPLCMRWLYYTSSRGDWHFSAPEPGALSPGDAHSGGGHTTILIFRLFSLCNLIQALYLEDDEPLEGNSLATGRSDRLKSTCLLSPSRALLTNGQMRIQHMHLLAQTERQMCCSDIFIAEICEYVFMYVKVFSLF